MFLAMRRGMPICLAFLGFLCAGLFRSYRGWWLLLSVACIVEVAQSFRRGAAYLKHMAAIVHRDGLWVKAVRPLARAFGCEEAWLRSFLAWNNRRVEEAFAGGLAQRALILLPHCVQLASCRLEVTEELGRCHQCGRCPLGDVLESSMAEAWEVRIFNRSHKAARFAKEYQPDLMVAVSCTDRLLKGILKLPDKPCFAIPLDLCHGMCVDTAFDTALLDEAMARLVRPRSEASRKVQPLRTHESA